MIKFLEETALINSPTFIEEPKHRVPTPRVSETPKNIIKKETIIQETVMSEEQLHKVIKESDRIKRLLRGSKGDQGVPGTQGETIFADPINKPQLTTKEIVELLKRADEEDIEFLKGPKGDVGQKGHDGFAGGIGPVGAKGDAGDPGETTVSTIEFNAVTGVVGSSETQILLYTNSSGSVKKLNAIGGEGNLRGEWTIYLNDILILKPRSSVSDPNFNIPMNDLQITNGSTIKVKVTHYESVFGEFSAEVNYHT